jgi:hypothetical protein
MRGGKGGWSPRRVGGWYRFENNCNTFLEFMGLTGALPLTDLPPCITTVVSILPPSYVGRVQMTQDHKIFIPE